MGMKLREMHSIITRDTRDADHRSLYTYQIKRSRSAVLVSFFVHLPPIGVTFEILQLSFRNVYFADADVGNRVKLSALQVARKVHEILVLLSLSSMVLHYTRKVLVSQEGVSFGLLEAAYQSSLSSNPITLANWEALKHLITRAKKNNGSPQENGG
jgi:hypothetical protein